MRSQAETEAQARSRRVQDLLAQFNMAHGEAQAARRELEELKQLHLNAEMYAVAHACAFRPRFSQRGLRVRLLHTVSSESRSGTATSRCS